LNKLIIDENDKKQKPVSNNFDMKFLLKISIIVITAAFFIRAFFLEGYKIPTGSMENTLLPGDYIIVNKASYSFSTPRYIPVINFEIPFIKIFSHKIPERNDIIVFSRNDLMPGLVKTKEEIRRGSSFNFIKRVVGLPGDTIEIKNNEVFINGKKINSPLGVKINKTDFKTEDENGNIYPKGMNWNSDNYGPVLIPSAGTIIKLNSSNIKNWKNLINDEYGKMVISEEGSVVAINGKPVREFKLKKNYFFVLGDNRDNSMDSRHFGFVSEESIIGEALFIYWSVDNNNTVSSGLTKVFNSIRFNRILNGIN
jgi:signal peptidase I